MGSAATAADDEMGASKLADLSIEEESDESSPRPTPSRSPSISEDDSLASPPSLAEPSAASNLHSRRSEIRQPVPRNRSPYARSHLRSHSAAGTLSAPAMGRTRSMPSTYTGGGFLPSPTDSPARPSSPVRSPTAIRAGPRRSLDESYPHPLTPSFMDIESIAEDSELDITPRAPPPDFVSSQGNNYPLQPAHTIPRSNSGSRRRSSSPLHSLSQAPLPPSPRSSFAALSAGASSGMSPSTTPPPVNTSRFNETFPGTAAHFFSTTSSSVPSTPTSLRSRSPSISSLETIADSPDAEEAAMEAFNIAKLKAAADAVDSASESDGDGDGRPKTSGGLLVRAGGRDGRNKRWSVCGAERRGDFEMETIWED